MSRTLVLAGLALASVAMAAQDGIVLRRTLTENATETYKIETKVAQTVNLPNGMGEQEMNINTQSTYKLTTGKVDATKGTAAVTVETIVDKIDADGPMGDMLAQNKPKPTKIEGTIDAKGHIEMDKTKAAASAMQSMGASSQMTNGVLIDFPDKAVKVGDTWDVVVPKSPFTGSADQKLTAKLVGEKKVGDKDVWVVSLTGTLKLDMDSSKLPKDNSDASNPMAGQTMHVKGTIDMTSESLVEKSTGRTLRTETKIKSKQTVEMVEMGMTVDSNGTSTSVATLQE